MKDQNPIILFDGICNLCNGTVDFLLKRDYKKQFRFASIQSEAAQLLFRKYHISAESDSVILIKSNQVYFESDAAIEIAGMLHFPWKIGVVLRIIPKKMRDNIYRWVAKNRYQWFGKRDVCRVPAPSEKESFIL
ncbi:MAG: thiol-disulfide oxidoreductase DCC family protein [Bacteroidetes bacterium]|nr:MAG: thiol-disulfide oxidoreductase DCC family protein [Bacteroidota bacterium]